MKWLGIVALPFGGRTQSAGRYTYSFTEGLRPSPTARVKRFDPPLNTAKRGISVKNLVKLGGLEEIWHTQATLDLPE